MSYDYLSEAEALKQSFVDYIKRHQGSMTNEAREGMREILVDIKMLLYSYDPEMPLTEISRSFPSSDRCLNPGFFGCDDSTTSTVVVNVIDKLLMKVLKLRGNYRSKIVKLYYLWQF